jgi:hypothetical protein
MIFEILYWILSLLIFLPNINLFFSFSKSEIFPWAILFSFSKNIRFSIPYLLFIIYLTVSAVLIFDKNGDWLQPFRSLSAIFNATFIFYRILFCTNKEFNLIENSLFIVFLICIFLGFLQYFNLFPNSLVEFMSNLIPRFKPNIAINDIRGITSLFSEPAYYAYSFNYSVFYILYRKQIKPNNILGVLAFLFILVFNIFFIRSATGLIFSILYIFFLFPLKQRGVFVIIFTIIGIIAVTYFSQDLSKYRAISAFNQIFSKSSTYDIYVTFLDVSGFRAVSIMFSYLYGFGHFFGGGVGNWEQTSAIAYQSLGIPISNLSYYANGYFTATRPSSIIADIMLESGLLGLLLFLLSFAKYIFNKQLWSNPSLRSFIIIIIFNIFIIGTIGDPTPFIFLGLICRNLFNYNLDIT